MKIRRATEADVDKICEIRALAIRAGAASHYSPGEVASWHGARTSDAYLDPIRTKIVVVAESAEELLGFGQLDPDSAMVEAIYVAPANMRHGVGARLLAELESRAILLGLSQLALDASLNAVSFYERVGYVAIQEDRHQPRQDVVKMVKLLEAGCTEA